MKRQVKKEHDKMAKAVELYKAFEKFENEVFESSEGTFNYVSSQYRNLIKILYPEVDISKVTLKVAVKMGVKRNLESSLEAAEEPAKESDRSPIKVNITEDIAAESISVVPPIGTEVLEASKKLESILAAEPTTTDATENLELIKKELIKEDSNAPIIIK